MSNYSEKPRGSCCSNPDLNKVSRDFKNDEEVLHVYLECDNCGAEWIDVYKSIREVLNSPNARKPVEGELEEYALVDTAIKTLKSRSDTESMSDAELQDFVENTAIEKAQNARNHEHSFEMSSLNFPTGEDTAMAIFTCESDLFEFEDEPIECKMEKKIHYREHHSEMKE